MRLHRGKGLHKERWRDQELKPADHHHSRGRLEEETGLVEGGKMYRKEPGEANTVQVSPRILT